LYETGKADRQEMGYSGEFMMPVYYSHRRKAVDYYQAPRTPTDGASARTVIDAPWTDQQATLEMAVGYWLRHFGLGEQAAPTKSRGNPGLLSLRVALRPGKVRRDITEIGFGISQLLPVIIQGLLLPENGLLIADLPEAHLHPDPQAEIADFFCSMILAGRRALVETHSEMFFHQLRLRAAMNQDLAENIAVYFVDSPDEGGLCRDPRRVDLGAKGEITWPIGFLDEAWDKESQIKLVREARDSSR
jgi:predicted ATPase